MLLYLHYPFCRRKCAYCGFSSRSLCRETEKVYLRGLLRDIAFWGERLQRPVLRTLYFGGGTPSLLRAKDLEAILRQLSSYFSWPEGVEFSLEANPDSLNSRDYIRFLRQLGVNRISLGLQSLEDSNLLLLERPHSVQQGIRSIEEVRAAGMERLGLDLLWGIPGQSPGAWIRDLQEALELGADHLSCYCLSLEKGTKLWNKEQEGELSLPNEEELEDMFVKGSRLLQEQGFLHYEIANFALPGAACEHNLGYWRGEDYLGLGPSAVSTLGNSRWSNPEDVQAYARAAEYGSLAGNAEVLTSRDRAREKLMLSLRRREGLDMEEYRALSGENIQRTRAVEIDSLHQRGLLWMENGRLGLTLSGMLLSDSITQALMQ